MHREPSRVPCPICGASHFKEIKKFPDGVIVGRCDECGTTYTPFMHATPEGLFTDSDEKILRYVYAPILEKRVKHFRHGTRLGSLCIQAEVKRKSRQRQKQR